MSLTLFHEFYVQSRRNFGMGITINSCFIHFLEQKNGRKGRRMPTASFTLLFHAIIATANKNHFAYMLVPSNCNYFCRHWQWKTSLSTLNEGHWVECGERCRWIRKRKASFLRARRTSEAIRYDTMRREVKLRRRPWLPTNVISLVVVVWESLQSHWPHIHTCILLVQHLCWCIIQRICPYVFGCVCVYTYPSMNCDIDILY